MNNNNYIFTIITVVKNEKKRLQETIKNIQKQTYRRIQYVIIDSASTDGTAELIKKYEDYINYWVSEPDNGIYDAMNKGLFKSDGEYILFLNAGDTFPDVNTLQNVADQIEQNGFPDFIYGDAFEIDVEGNHFLRHSRMSSHKTVGMFTHHQSMYYRREIVERFNLRYDTSLQIAADYKFTCQFLEHARSELYIAKPLSVFLQGGLSQIQWTKSMKEQIEVKRDVLKMSFWKIYMIYFMQLGWHVLKEKIPWLYRRIRFKR